MRWSSILYLLWATLHDHGVIPRNLVQQNKITSHGELVIGKIIDEKVVICWLGEFEEKSEKNAS